MNSHMKAKCLGLGPGPRPQSGGNGPGPLLHWGPGLGPGFASHHFLIFQDILLYTVLIFAENLVFQAVHTDSLYTALAVTQHSNLNDRTGSGYRWVGGHHYLFKMPNTILAHWREPEQFRGHVSSMWLSCNHNDIATAVPCRQHRHAAEIQ